jgi:hypothetical protein
MRLRILVLSLAAGLTAVAALGACSDPPPVNAQESAPAGGPNDPRTTLAARAAMAKDLHQVAVYRLRTPERPDRTVTMTFAKDGGWRLDIPGTALGGTVDIALARTAAGLYQCALPSAGHPESGCVRLSRVAAAYDPKLQHLFTDWLEVFMDRDAALAVSATAALPGVPGTCFAVDSSAVSIKSPIDAGIYCYADDGTLTGARTAVGTLSLTGTPTAGPASVTLPGAVTPGQPLPNASPPPPSPSPSVTSTTSGR